MSSPSIFSDVSDLLRRAVAADLVTMSRWFPAERQLERVFSTNGAIYPVGGRKDKPVTPWSETVLRSQLPHIARDAAEIRVAFDDHELIARHEITSILNVPVSQDGACVGTVNLMGRQAYCAEDAERAAAIIGTHAAALSAAMRAFEVG